MSSLVSSKRAQLLAPPAAALEDVQLLPGRPNSLAPVAAHGWQGRFVVENPEAGDDLGVLHVAVESRSLNP
jgi:hypothetical protein